MSGSPNYSGSIFASLDKIRSKPIALLKFTFKKSVDALITYFLEVERIKVLKIFLKFFSTRFELSKLPFDGFVFPFV